METNLSLPTRPARLALTGRSILVLAAATLLVPLGARWSPDGHVAAAATRTVPYAYRDVTSAGLVPALYRRFQREAQELCASVELAGADDPGLRDYCAQRVVDRAVRTIGAPALTEYHESLRGPAATTRIARADRAESTRIARNDGAPHSRLHLIM
jgi:UrcA family protein